MRIPPFAYSAAIPAASYLLKLSAYAAPIFSSSGSMSIMRSPAAVLNARPATTLMAESLAEILVIRSATRWLRLQGYPTRLKNDLRPATRPLPVVRVHGNGRSQSLAEGGMNERQQE